MDSLTQIILGAAVGEAVAGKKMGHKAPLWGAIAGTIPDLDVFLQSFFHPIDAMLVHRGFSHSLLFALLFSPVFAWLTYRLYKKKFAFNDWWNLFFLSIVTHPMLDMFTNYGTQFLWPFDYRITFNTVFVIDPLYTLPFGFCVLVILFLKKESTLRRRLNHLGLIMSTVYLLWGVGVKLFILSNSDKYFEEVGVKAGRTMVTPQPLTSFYWMLLTEENGQYFLVSKSLFAPVNEASLQQFPKNIHVLNELKWAGKNYSPTLRFISNDYFLLTKEGDNWLFSDLRFGTAFEMTNRQFQDPVMGFLLEMKDGKVIKVNRHRMGRAWQKIEFQAYLDFVFGKR
jgi:inner membrane protein